MWHFATKRKNGINHSSENTQTSSLRFEVTIWKENFQEPEGLTGLETKVLLFKGQVYPSISFGQLPQAKVIILYSSVQVARRRFGTESGQIAKVNGEV